MAIANHSIRARCRRMTNITLVAAITAAFGIGTVVSADVVTSDAEVERLLGMIRSAPPSEIEATMQRLAGMGSSSVPALTKGLEDLTIQAACAETLILMPPEVAIPALKGAIDRAPVTSSRARLGKAYLIASLGQIGSNETVPYLEILYSREGDKTSSVAVSLAWALQHITGREYGPAVDVRVGCRQIVNVEAP